MTTNGKFIVGDEMVISDPCYNFPPNEKVGPHRVPVLHGSWRFNIGREDGRVKKVYLTHVDNSFKDLKSEKFECGVDSGQLGFFCSSVYPQGETGEYGDLTSFYGRVCEDTINGIFLVENGKGLCTNSGYGDGLYTVFGSKREDGKFVSFEVDFMYDGDDTNE